MTLSEKIIHTRKRKGITQEELALSAQLTVRTIQRIESGESTPRPFTLKAIATGLAIPFEDLLVPATGEHKTGELSTGAMQELNTSAEQTDFLRTLSLSCFSYLVVPFIHFLIPVYLLRKRNEILPATKAFARHVIRIQICWVIALNLLLFLTLVYNLICVAYLQRSYTLHYLVPLSGMYLLNAGIIIRSFIRSKQTDCDTKAVV